MFRSLARFTLSLCVTSLLACGGETDPGDVGTPDAAEDDAGLADAGVADAGPADVGGIGPVSSDPFDPRARSVELATAICAYREACEPIYATYLPETRRQCETRETAALRATWNAFPVLITAQRAGFVAAELSRCVSAYATAMTDCALGPEPGACDGMFVGNRPSPASCGHEIECLPGNWCTAQPLGCGLCVPKAGVAGDCSAAPCVAGATCVAMGNGHMCVPDGAELGAACGTPSTGVCRGHLQCVGPAAGPFSCVRPAALSASCDATGAAADCDFYAGQACDGTQHCAAATVVAPTTACGDANPTNLCNAASTCAANQCEALPAAGAVCTEISPCNPNLRCVPDAPGAMLGHCRVPLRSGASCASTIECSSSDVCIALRCGPLLIDSSCN